MPNLDTPLDQVKGVGEKTYDQLSLAGLRTVRDLIYFFPRTHDDYSQVQKIAGIRPGKVSVQGRFQQVTTRRVRRGMTVTEAVQLVIQAGAIGRDGELGAVRVAHEYDARGVVARLTGDAGPPARREAVAAVAFVVGLAAVARDARRTRLGVGDGGHSITGHAASALRTPSR